MRATSIPALTAILLLAGCASAAPGGQPAASPDPGGVTTETCVSWVEFETPSDAAEDAEAVVRGTIGDPAGTAPVFGVDAPVWTVDVAEWIEGEGPDRIEVISTPVTCEGTPSPDPFASAEGEMILFLHLDESRWRGITPLQALVAPGPDGQVPARWK